MLSSRVSVLRCPVCVCDAMGDRRTPCLALPPCLALRDDPSASSGLVSDVLGECCDRCAQLAPRGQAGGV